MSGGAWGYQSQSIAESADPCTAADLLALLDHLAAHGIPLHEVGVAIEVGDSHYNTDPDQVRRPSVVADYYGHGHALVFETWR